MDWYYFARLKGGGLFLVPRDQMGSRPDDARDGDEYTPWYQEGEHFDDHHVHVQGVDELDAYDRACELIGST